MRTLGMLAGLSAAAIWGGMYVVSKVVLETIPPFTLLTLRLLIGAACLAAVILLTSKIQANSKQVLKVFLVGFVGYGISLGLQFSGTKLSSAASAALVTSASPLFIFLFGAWLLGEKVTIRRVIALVLASIGVLIVVDPRQAVFGGQAAVGNLLLVGAAITWGLYSVLIKKVSGVLGVLEISMIAFLGGLPVSMPVSALEIQSVGIGELDAWLALGVLYLGVISTALAMYLWNKSLAILEAGLVSLLFFAQPVVGVSLGAILLKEQLGTGFWIGALLIGVGLIVASRADREGSR